MKQQYDVIVVGAGMVGASAALAMARQNYRVALIERQQMVPQQEGLPEQHDLRVSAISPASQQLLSELGVWQEVIRQRSCDFQSMTVWHQNGPAQMHFHSEQIGVSHLGTIVENNLVQAELLRHLHVLPNVQLFPQQQIVSIDQQADRVCVGTSSTPSIQAKLLIAADGRASTVRRLLQLPATSGSYRQTAIVANVTTEKAHQYTAWQRFLVTGPLAFLPLSNGQCSIVWSADSERAEQLLQQNDSDFMQQLSAAFEFRLGKVVATSERAGFPLSWHAADCWLQDRVLLIGDAAHGVHPLAGQGVNLGFGDVALLSQLTAAGESIYQPRQLRRFERQRKAETVTATHLFSALKVIYGQDAALVCQLRDAGMSLVNGNVMLKRLVLQSAVSNMV